jgi:endonuclease G
VRKRKQSAIVTSITILLAACMASPPMQKMRQASLPDRTSAPGRVRASGNILRLDYEGFTVWVDCARRGPVKFQYNAQHDGGNQARAENFRLDLNVPKECQQTSAAAYGHGYDRGHQVPANHLDASPVAIKQSNYMTNILPQVAQMNRGHGYKPRRLSNATATSMSCW